MGYDAYYVALEAIKAAGSSDKAAVKAALPGVTYAGVSGAIAFDDIGDAIRDTAYHQDRGHRQRRLGSGDRPDRFRHRLSGGPDPTELAWRGSFPPPGGAILCWDCLERGRESAAFFETVLQSTI